MGRRCVRLGGYGVSLGLPYANPICEVRPAGRRAQVRALRMKKQMLSRDFRQQGWGETHSNPIGDAGRAQVRALRVKKQMLFRDFRQLAAQELGVAPERQRWWRWARRQNGTLRPSAVLAEVDDALTVMDLARARPGPAAPAVNLQGSERVTRVLSWASPWCSLDLPPLCVNFKLVGGRRALQRGPRARVTPGPPPLCDSKGKRGVQSWRPLSP